MRQSPQTHRKMGAGDGNGIAVKERKMLTRGNPVRAPRLIFELFAFLRCRHFKPSHPIGQPSLGECTLVDAPSEGQATRRVSS